MKLTYKTPDEKVVATLSVDSVDESQFCQGQVEITRKLFKAMSLLIGGLMLSPTRHKFMLDASIMYYYIEACSNMVVNVTKVQREMAGEKRKEQRDDKEQYEAD